MTTATLKWTNPTSRKNGETLDPSDIAQVEVFDDVGNGEGPKLIGAPTGAATNFTTFTDAPLAPGPHAFTVVVVTTNGKRSAPSNVAEVDVPSTEPVSDEPVAVSDLSVTLNTSG